MLFHAGRGIPALGEDTVRLSGEFTDARLILAHAGISDLAWLWRVLPDHPNVFLDTAWWNPADLIAVFSLVAPSQILWASDSPYGLPLSSAAALARCALTAGVDDEALRSIFGGQMARIVAGEEPAWVGEAPGPPRPRTTRCSSASTRTSSRRWDARSAAATRPSRSRSRGWRAPWARTVRKPTSAPPCSSCSTCSASTSRRRRRAARSRSRGGS